MDLNNKQIRVSESASVSKKSLIDGIREGCYYKIHVSGIQLDIGGETEVTLYGGNEIMFSRSFTAAGNINIIGANFFGDTGDLKISVSQNTAVKGNLTYYEEYVGGDVSNPPSYNS